MKPTYTMRKPTYTNYLRELREFQNGERNSITITPRMIDARFSRLVNSLVPIAKCRKNSVSWIEVRGGVPSRKTIDCESEIEALAHFAELATSPLVISATTGNSTYCAEYDQGFDDFANSSLTFAKADFA